MNVMKTTNPVVVAAQIKQLTAFSHKLANAPDSEKWVQKLVNLSDQEAKYVLCQLSQAQLVTIFSRISPELAADVVAYMQKPQLEAVLTALPQRTVEKLLRILPAHEREAIFDFLTNEEALQLQRKLNWPDESVGAHMHSDVLTLSVTQSLSEAKQVLYEAWDTPHHHLNNMYVVNEYGQLVGEISLKMLLVASADQTLSDIMQPKGEVLDVSLDQEQASRRLLDLDVTVLPVEHNGLLVGFFFLDDAVDILEKETTEDAAMQGGSMPLDASYLQTSPWNLWKKRIGWLLALFLAEAYTGTVLRAFEEQLEAAIALAFFIPLLIGTGGNSGTQITTTIIRAMAVGEVSLKNLGSVLSKELTTGVMIALAMAGAAWVRAWSLGVGVEVGLVVTLTILAIVLWSAFVSSIIPMVLRRLSIDPAVVSAPFIATLVDGTGLVIYFEIAKLILPELA